MMIFDGVGSRRDKEGVGGCGRSFRSLNGEGPRYG